MQWLRGAKVVGALAVAASTLPRAAHADEPERHEEHARPPIPEQLLTESVTDVDGDEAGETEIVVNSQSLGSRSGGAYVRAIALEVESRVTRRIGLRLEPAVAWTSDGRERDHEFGLNAAASYALFHDFVRDLHLQVEAAARVFGNEPLNITVPGDLAARYSIGFRGAARVGAFSLRPAIGLDAGGTIAHAPVWGGIGLLYALGDGGRFGFVAMEGEVDGSRRHPFVIAPNWMADLAPLGLPIRFGFALPFVMGADASEPSYGVYLRVMFRTAVD